MHIKIYRDFLLLNSHAVFRFELLKGGQRQLRKVVDKRVPLCMRGTLLD